jgi:glycosyltransferase involved in cell wall biosynthesis
MTPELTVVVPSHDRPLRLRWLLNALEAQTLDHTHWEVVVAHDSAGAETEELLTKHPLAAAGVLRHLTFTPGTEGPSSKRNAGWRAARGRWVVFTDDDCRPPEDWLTNAYEAVQRHPEAIIQGATQKDPRELVMLRASFVHAQWINPPTVWAESCNIIYPRALLESLGGFDVDLWVGEDTDLALRGRALGADHLGATEVQTYHAVEELSFRDAVRVRKRWRHLPPLFKRHPQLRDEVTLWVFWKRHHLWAPFFVAGVTLAKRNQAWGLMCVPWIVHSAPIRGTNPRGRYREVLDLPARLVLDGVEMAQLVRGSVQYRSLML